MNFRPRFTIAMGSRICALLLVLSAGNVSLPAHPPAPQFIVYVGTYTGAKSKGIYAFRFDSATGRLAPLGLVGETVNPSFLAIHPNRRFLFAVNEVNEFSAKKNNGGVSAFAIERATGKLSLLNSESTGGGSPCHLTVDARGQNLFVANYGGGSVSVLPIETDGRVRPSTSFVQHTGSSVNKNRQQGPHAHGIYPDRSGRFVAVADLGLDRILIYRLDHASRSLQANNPPFGSVAPGSGPRHLAFHPNNRFAYVNNEMSSTVTTFAWDGAKGSLKELQTVSTLPEGFAGSNSTAEIEVHPTGKFVYVSNRGHHSIAVFEVDATKGTLRLIEHQSTQGKTPRGFGIDPTGQFLLAANQGSDTMVVFRIDTRTGRLMGSGESVEVGAPVCVQFLPVE